MFESLSSYALLAQANDVPFYNKGWFVFLLLIASVALGIFLAGFITKAMKVGEFNGRMAIVLVALFVASLMIWAKWPPKLGVDLSGGINMVASLNLEAWNDDDGMGERPKAKDIIPALIRRVNPSGTKEIMIRPLGDDKIEVTIPSVDQQEADDIWDRLVKAGKLEFRIVADSQNFRTQVELARKMAAEGGRGREVQEVGTGDTPKTVAVWVSLARIVEEGALPDAISPFKYIPQPGQLVRDKSTGKILDLSSVRYGNPEREGEDLAKWAKANGIRTLQILVIHPEEAQNVEGKYLKNVQSTIDEQGRGAVSFNTSDEGSSKMGMLTRMNVGRPMGIVLDGQLHSAPNIESAIYNSGRITGEFTPEEVNELIINLESGKLEVALNKAPISRDFIESTLGQELKDKGIWAISCSLILVLVFMLFYYRFAGIVATTGLLFNLVLILALVMAINQPLTLTGLAGLVLTVGMSVDANVLIFERMREELDRGAALRMAIRNGFDKATTTIVDANVTTLITALVLYVIGTEQIKGFSVTLILGILMSMFTAIFVSRLIFDICERRRILTKLNMTRILDRNKWNFLNKVGMTGVVSVLLILVGITGVFMLGPKILNHDLRGGSTVRMVFNEPQDVENIRKVLDDENIDHKGEKVEFTVTEFGNQDPSKAKKVFKVDSNLPAWEGDLNNKFEQLDDVLARVFAGQLELHHVDIEGISNVPSNPETTNPAPEEGAPSPSTPEVGMRWEATPSISALTTGVLTYQDPKQDPPTTEPVETQTPETTPPVSQDTPPVSQDTPPASQDTPPASQDTPAASEDPNDGPELMIPKEIKVTRTMKVTPAVSGKTLKALLIEAATRVNVELEDEQVDVTTKDVHEDESPLTTVSEDWTVTMDVTKSGDADQILTEWATQFNQLPYFPTSSKVGGQIAGQTQLQALAAVIASLLGIITYVWIRFQNVAFGLAAVIALIHDVLIVVGAIAISHWLAGTLGFLGIVEFKISLEIVAALLTVIGYSLNDTIVVFDRIREVRGKRSEITADMINTSISQTLSRTILTSITTFIVVFILYCFGGEAIHGFAFALVVGVVVGTYSSIFIASPALLWLMNTVGLNPGVVDPAAE